MKTKIELYIQEKNSIEATKIWYKNNLEHRELDIGPAVSFTGTATKTYFWYLEDKLQYYKEY